MPVREQTCPHCKHKTTKIKDYRYQLIKDIPIRFKTTYLYYRKRRYQCKNCGKTFYEKVSFLTKRGRKTTRVTEFIVDRLKRKQSMKDISNDANVSVNVSVKQSTKIVNWYKGAESDIVTDGYGKTGGKGMAMARIAAITDAQRNLLGIIKGVQIDSDTFMEDLIISSDIVKRKINGMLRGAQIIEEQEKDDDTYYVKMRVPLYGSTDSLASVVMPEIIRRARRIVHVGEKCKIYRRNNQCKWIRNGADILTGDL